MFATIVELRTMSLKSDEEKKVHVKEKKKEIQEKKKEKNLVKKCTAFI